MAQTVPNPWSLQPPPLHQTKIRSAASVIKPPLRTLTERTSGVGPRPNPGRARKAQASHKQLAATQEVSTKHRRAKGLAQDQISQSVLSMKRPLSLADRSGSLRRGQAQPRGWPAGERASPHVLSPFCAPASAEICPSFLKVVETLFLGTPSSYQAATDLFRPDADMKAATSKLKDVVDHIPEHAKDGIMRFMVRGWLPSSRRWAADSPKPPPARLRCRPMFWTPFFIQRGHVTTHTSSPRKQTQSSHFWLRGF